MIYDENSPYNPANNAGAVGGNIQNSNGGNTGTQTPTPTPSQNTGTDTPATPDASTPAPDNQGGNTNTPAPDNQGGDSNGGAPASDLPSTPADILAKYTEITDYMRKNLKSHTTKEYQEVPELNLGSSPSSISQPIINGILTTADKAELQQKEGSGAIPPWSGEGCALTDPNFIKSASCKDNGDGTATMIITLKDEKNSQPPKDGVHSSEIGKMFSPLNKADIDNTLAGISVITVNSFDLTYTDCTVTIVYNKENLQLKSMVQIMNIDITASIKFLGNINATGKVINHMEMQDFVY